MTLSSTSIGRNASSKRRQRGNECQGSPEASVKNQPKLGFLSFKEAPRFRIPSGARPREEREDRFLMPERTSLARPAAALLACLFACSTSVPKASEPPGPTGSA